MSNWFTRMLGKQQEDDFGDLPDADVVYDPTTLCVDAFAPHNKTCGELEAHYGPRPDYSWVEYRIKPILDAGVRWYRVTKVHCSTRINGGDGSIELMDYFDERDWAEQMVVEGNEEGRPELENNKLLLESWFTNREQVVAAYYRSLSTEELTGLIDLYNNTSGLGRYGRHMWVAPIYHNIINELKARGISL